jgi:hypothetical protein
LNNGHSDFSLAKAIFVDRIGSWLMLNHISIHQRSQGGEHDANRTSSARDAFVGRRLPACEVISTQFIRGLM